MHLALYKYDSCGYCMRVMRTIAELGLQDRIEMRDIYADPDRQRELIEARGRRTVPVLRIEDEGEVRWMGESAAIDRWLRDRFADAG